MKYVIDISQRQAKEMELLIEKGKYQNFAQFIVTAIENQIYIEKLEPQQETISDKDNFVLRRNFHGRNGYPEVETHVKLPSPDKFPPTVPMPKFCDLSYSLLQADEKKCWLWGQVNKIFPIKLGIRILLVLLDSEQWMALDKFASKAADIALFYGEMIRTYEKKENKKRLEKIYAGLPTAKKEEFKSKMRYRSHFLAYMRKDGKLDGALSFLRFINLKRDEKRNILIGITKEGLQFSRLKNPIIDVGDIEKSLDTKEIDFYLKHISMNVKGEENAIIWLLSKLDMGIDKREDINKEFKKEMGEIWNNSDAVINTQRAGLMSRMFELGLIEKEKKGVNVTYIISNNGKKFLDQH